MFGVSNFRCNTYEVLPQWIIALTGRGCQSCNLTIGWAKKKVCTQVFDVDDLNPSRATFPGERFDFKGNILSEDVAWFGLAGMLLACAALVTALRSLLRRDLLWGPLALLPISFLAAWIVFFRWQPWGGRLFCTAALLTVPLGVKGLALLVHRRPRFQRRAVWHTLGALAVCGAFTALLQNELKPLIAVGSQKSVWELTRDEQRCRHRPYNLALLQYAAETAPEIVGVCADEDQWDYLAFGPGFRHRVVRYGSDIDWSAAFARDGCNAIVIQRNFAVAVPGGYILTPLNDYWAVVRR
jgi:hypothetical protein